MGFLRRLFGRDNAERPDEASDFDESSMEDVDDNEEGWDEALSYEDAHDIWLSSGMDEDYDFRPTPDLDEGYIPGLQHSRDQSPQELLEEWRAEHPPLTTSRWPNIEDFDESEEYEFWCAECEGYGVIAFEAYWDDELLSFLDDCDLCEGRGFYVLEGEDARESFELGHGLAVYQAPKNLGQAAAQDNKANREFATATHERDFNRKGAAFTIAGGLAVAGLAVVDKKLLIALAQNTLKALTQSARPRTPGGDLYIELLVPRSHHGTVYPVRRVALWPNDALPDPTHWAATRTWAANAERVAKVYAEPGIHQACLAADLLKHEGKNITGISETPG